MPTLKNFDPDHLTYMHFKSFISLFHLERIHGFLKFYLLLAVLGLCCCADFSLVVASEGYSLVAVGASHQGPSPAGEHGLEDTRARGHTGFNSGGTWAQ